jgi:hypothetical protein
MLDAFLTFLKRYFSKIRVFILCWTERIDMGSCTGRIRMPITADRSTSTR